MTTTLSMSSDLYGIPNSKWTSPEWNWGYAVGTGHDCAAICRNRWSTKSKRTRLVESLITGQSNDEKDEDNMTISVDEIKLVLALKIQRGRWDGSDGGNGGYGDVMNLMADARRYETEDNNDGNRQLLHDMKIRFPLLNPNKEDMSSMESLLEDGENDEDIEAKLLKCSGLVLKAMGFIENGI